MRQEDTIIRAAGIIVRALLGKKAPRLKKLLGRKTAEEYKAEALGRSTAEKEKDRELLRKLAAKVAERDEQERKKRRQA